MVVYFAGGGAPWHAVAQGHSKPHGPQPARLKPKAESITRTATRRAIRRTPSTGVIYTGILTKSRTESLIPGSCSTKDSAYSGSTRVTCPILRPGRAAVLP